MRTSSERGRTVPMTVEAWIAENRPRLLDEPFHFIRAPSVSTDPSYAAASPAPPGS